MRPIDADMLKCYQFKNPISHKALCNLIDRQPTVNRMIGRWKEVPGPITEDRGEGHPRRYMIGVPVPMQGTAYIFDNGNGIERIGTAVLVIGDVK